MNLIGLVIKPVMLENGILEEQAINQFLKHYAGDLQTFSDFNATMVTLTM